MNAHMRALAAATALTAAAAVAVAGTALARPAAPQFLQVTEKEWQITLSRASVKKGKVFVELVNFGTDNHDLVLRSNRKGARPLSFKAIAPNARSEKALTLLPGRYALWCSLPGHKARGMRTTLVVRS